MNWKFWQITLTDSHGNIWKMTPNGRGTYGLVQQTGRPEQSKGVEANFDSGVVSIGDSPTVKWAGDTWYADSLVIGEDGRVITGSMPWPSNPFGQ